MTTRKRKPDKTKLLEYDYKGKTPSGVWYDEYEFGKCAPSKTSVEEAYELLKKQAELERIAKAKAEVEKTTKKLREYKIHLKEKISMEYKEDWDMIFDDLDVDLEVEEAEPAYDYSTKVENFGIF